MDTLFNATIVYNGQTVICSVYFIDEAYRFQSGSDDTILLQLYREKDEWHTKEPVDKLTKRQAIEALDSYLLAQH